MKAIRWGGFLTFMVVTVLIAVVMFFSGIILKPVLESKFSDMNGAKVDIESINIAYSPFSLEINNIQIADPQQAMLNTAEIEQVRFALSFGNMLLGKVIVDQASIDGVRIDTSRQNSGFIEQAVEQQGKSEPEDDNSIAMLDMQLPNIKELLKAETLLTEKLIDELEKDYAETEKRWNKINASLLNKSKSDQYEKRYKKIQQDSKGDARKKLAAIKDAKQLSKELKAEAQAIKQAKEQFSADSKRLSAELRAVKNAPSKDIARIKNKYNLGGMDAENISRMLFGDKAADYTAMARQWYARIEPYLSDDEEAEKQDVDRGKGVNVVFKEFDPKPDVYIRKASLTANLPRGKFEGVITAISSDQSINKEPMRFKLQGVSLTNKESEKISGEFNYVDKKNGFSRFDYSVVKSKIDGFVLSKSNSLPLTMKQALMDFNLDAKLQHGSLNGKANAKFRKVNFDSEDSSSMLASSFSGIDAFDIEGQFRGAIDELSIKIDSDLDSKLGQQLKNKLKQKKQTFDNELRASIDEKLKQPLSKVDAQKEKLDVIEDKVDASKKHLDQRLAALKQTISQASEEKKTEASDKLKNKLKNKFGF